MTSRITGQCGGRHLHQLQQTHTHTHTQTHTDKHTHTHTHTHTNRHKTNVSKHLLNGIHSGAVFNYNQNRGEYFQIYNTFLNIIHGILNLQMKAATLLVYEKQNVLFGRVEIFSVGLEKSENFFTLGNMLRKFHEGL